MLLTLAGWLILLPVALVTMVFIVETGLGIAPPGKRRDTGEDSVTAVVLVPAHDEAGGIGAALARTIAVLPPGMRVLVVADNCTDATADVARAAGAEVIERQDAARRGKGYALAFGRDHLAAAPPDVVIVLDADCVPEPGALALLAGAARTRDAAIQSCYLFRTRPGAAPMVQISNFAILVKNKVRQMGLARLGAPVVLTGSGMAFPWRLFGRAALATDNIVEDLALGIELLRQGDPPRFAPDALVWTDPSTAQGTLTQRTRWENGFMAVARGHGLPLVGEGLRRGRGGMIWAGLHLLTPPLALLIGLNLAGLAALGLLLLAGMAPAPLIAQAILLAAVGLLVFAAWMLHGRALMGLGAVLRLPLYLLWKLPIYARHLRGGEKRWVRTERTGED